MLTGDNTLTGTAIAARAGIDTVHAEQLPADTAEHVNGLRAARARRRPLSVITGPAQSVPAARSRRDDDAPMPKAEVR